MTRRHERFSYLQVSGVLPTRRLPGAGRRSGARSAAFTFSACCVKCAGTGAPRGWRVTITSAVEASGVWAEINYIRNAPGAGRRGARVRDRGRGSLNTMVTLPGQSMWITNARASTPTSTARASSWCTTRARSPTSTRSRATPRSTQQYIEETAAMLAELTGAARVFMQGGGKKRYGESAIDKLGAAEEREAGAVPARRQHRRVGRPSSPSSWTCSSTSFDLERPLAVRDVQRVARASRRHRRTSRWPCATRRSVAPPTR